MAVPAHDERDFEFAEKFGLPIPVVVEPERNTHGEENQRSVHGVWGHRQLGAVFRAKNSRCALTKWRRKPKRGGLGRSETVFRLTGLGNFTATILGHPDSGHLLR